MEAGRIAEDEEGIEEMMRAKGMVRGVTLQTDAEYIREHAGEKGLKAVEEETKKMGHPIKYDQVGATKDFPIGLRAVSLIAAKRALNWDDERIMDIGRCAPKYSLFTKLMLRYFVSTETVVKKAPQYWRKHYNIGLMESEYRGDEKQIIIRLRNFKIHPLACKYLSGYFSGVIGMTRKFKKLLIKETKCMYKGDKYHEFIINWED